MLRGVLRLAAPALALVLFAGAVYPADLEGTYALNCAKALDDGKVRIAGDTIRFWESTCRLTNPVPVRDMTGAVLYDMVCRGEGQEWASRVLLMPTDDGLVRVEAGFAMTYERCR
ncbi:hypothetical protein [Roseovarius salinarum]|uniref:hypothetical protein n=1 Tax=Roseovarius salinarum TaxID=1981892 RepID=UPI000C31D695|nr:hypothetical protein [Roseovarius salinarum]